MPRRLLFEFAAVAAAIALALGARAYLFGIYTIPSGSMQPALLVGDYILVDKRAYRQGRLPARGDVVLFLAGSGRKVFVKRVIGLPGDTVALRGGTVILDGKAWPRWRVADWACPAPARCRLQRWREMLPESRTVDTLARVEPAADAGPVAIPPGRLFVLGDDRDRSADSRWPAGPRGAGLVAQARLVGRARAILFSSDGRARLRDPRSWWRTIRTERIGRSF